MKIRDIYEAWLPQKKNEVKMQSLACYVSHWQRRIEPHFGDTDYNSITSRDIQSFVDELMEQGLSKKSAADTAMTLKMLIHWAAEEYDLPLPRISKPLRFMEQSAVKQLPVYSENELAKIMTYIREHPSFPNLGILLTISTGMRIGEVCALRFADINLQERTVSIYKTCERIYTEEALFGNASRGARTRIIISDPKTSCSNRTLPLPPAVISIIRSSMGIVKPEYYICSGTDRLLEPRTFRKRYYDTVEAAGVKPVKFHGLRHTFATRLIKNKTDVKTTSALLGHSDIKITLDTYVHPDDEQKASAVNSIFKKLQKL